MLRLLVDEDFDNRIMRGLSRRQPDLDMVRVQDTQMMSEEDETILEWAFQEGRVLLTHDASTMTDFAYQRLREGKTFAGIVEVPQW
jgi:predicted nuclease of predicted toxin-antitoxin system